MPSPNSFEKAKQKAMEMYEDHLSQKRVDEKAIPIIECFMEKPGYFTTSSCSGRISLSYAPLKGKKKEHVFIKKWHDVPDSNDVLESIKSADWKDVLWLKFEPFIFHIGCKDLEHAEKLIKLCIDLGFKRSGIFRLSPFPLVEVIPTGYFSVALGKDKELFVDEKAIMWFCQVAKELLLLNEERLQRFLERIKDL